MASENSSKGLWIQEPTNSAAVVYIHGILSDGDSCWRSTDAYWPDLLAADQRMSPVGIYVFSYRADAFSAAYSLGDAVEALNAFLDLDGLLQLKKLIFVCHSMGGIVARQFIVTRQLRLVENGTEIGLFLVASPSMGSDYANLLSGIAQAVGNSQADALRFSDNNTWLNKLDRNFINLKESRRLTIVGQELIEDQFIVLPSVFKRQVVRPFSGAKYFGESLKIPHSDHWTIAKPSGPDALQHRLLVQFVLKFLRSSGISASHTGTERLSVPLATSSLGRAELLPPTAAAWEAPKERRFWENAAAAAVNPSELEAFLSEVRAAYDAGLKPPFTVRFPWISAATDFVNQSVSQSLSVEDRKRVASAREFIAEEQDKEAAFSKCVSFLLNEDLTHKYNWGTLSIDTSAEVLAAICNRTFNSERYKFDVLIPGREELYVTVALTVEECREMPYIKSNASEGDLYQQLRLYIGLHPDLPSMPYWFLYSKALPAFLDRFVFREGADPASGDLPINMSNWVVGLG